MQFSEYLVASFHKSIGGYPMRQDKAPLKTRLKLCRPPVHRSGQPQFDVLRRQRRRVEGLMTSRRFPTPRQVEQILDAYKMMDANSKASA